MSELDSVFTYEATPFKFGEGVTEEVGADLRRLGVNRALVVTDPHLASLGLPGRVAGYLEDSGVRAEVFPRVRVEPTDESWQEATEFARDRQVDGFVAVGGGSAIDTAKAANLYSSHPAEFLDYVNKPIGKGLPVPGMLRPLVGIPTTAGTASECTTVAVVGLKALQVKAGISHRMLRPSLALLDPLNTLTGPPMVTASCGIDVLCHAIESYTARPYDERERPAHPADRPPFVGSNPVSDLWSAKSIELTSEFLVRAVRDGDDREARAGMMLACTYAGMGFGNAGVHLPHAMGYPIAGLVKAYMPPDYPDTHPLVPHGMSVVLGAPAAFRFTAPSAPERYLDAARLMGTDVSEAGPGDAGEVIAGAISRLMREVGIPNGLSAIGYTASQIPDLVGGTLKQQRLLAQCRGPVTEEDLVGIFQNAMECW